MRRVSGSDEACKVISLLEGAYYLLHIYTILIFLHISLIYYLHTCYICVYVCQAGTTYLQTRWVSHGVWRLMLARSKRASVAG